MITSYSLYENDAEKFKFIYLREEVHKFMREGGGFLVVNRKLNNILQGKYCMFTQYKGDEISGVIDEVAGSGGIRFNVNGEWIPINIDRPVIIADKSNGKIARLKNLEIDPLEEEDWGYTIQESNESETKILIKDIVSKALKDNISVLEIDKKLKKLFIGETCTFMTPFEEIITEVKVKDVNFKLYYGNKYSIHFLIDREIGNTWVETKWVAVNTYKYIYIVDSKNKEPLKPKIRWYKNGKLDESAMTRSSTFIPFEIRDQIDSNFEISDVENYKMLKLNPNNLYLRVITNKVIDRLVTFYTFNYLYNKTSNTPITWKINRVRFNNSGLLVFEGKSRFGNEMSCIDERKEIIINESLLNNF